jgi:hypothetical protein
MSERDDLVEQAFHVPQPSVPPTAPPACLHRSTHMRGWTQVCDDCGLGREIY